MKGREPGPINVQRFSGGARSVLAAERVVRECLVGIALRKEGFDEENYLSPLATDDGRR